MRVILSTDDGEVLDVVEVSDAAPVLPLDRAAIYEALDRARLVLAGRPPRSYVHPAGECDVPSCSCHGEGGAS